MITRKTVLDQVELARSGEVRIRLGLLLTEDGAELDCKWHRTSIPLDGDVAAQMSVVNAHLTSMGSPELEAADIDRITVLHQVFADMNAQTAPADAKE